ncbi:MAG: SMP-30/gluconolactonase/LRE family protein [Phycisphaerales bacterium]
MIKAVIVSSLLALPAFSLAQVEQAPPSAGAQPADKTAELVADANAVVIASGFKFTEGPLWDGDALLFCDLQGDTIYRIKPGEKPAIPADSEKFRAPSGRAAGLTFDGEGRLLCAQFNGKVTRSKQPHPKAGAEYDILTEHSAESPLKSANDIVVAKDATIYFTDFGGGALKRIAADGKVSVIATKLKAPNGLTLSQDQKKLFVAEYGGQNVKVLDIATDGTTSEPRDFASTKGEGPGSPDGMKTDERGNIYTTGPGGIWVFTEAGEKLGIIKAPGVSNFCFGGEDGKTLFMTAGAEVRSIKMKVSGVKAPVAPGK